MGIIIEGNTFSFAARLGSEKVKEVVLCNKGVSSRATVGGEARMVSSVRRRTFCGGSGSRKGREVVGVSTADSGTGVKSSSHSKFPTDVFGSYERGGGLSTASSSSMTDCSS